MELECEPQRDQGMQELVLQVLTSKSEPIKDVGTSSGNTGRDADSNNPVTEKLTFSKYDGKMDANVIHSWLHQFNAYFATTKKTGNSNVLTAAMYLAGDAINWYHARQEAQLAAHLEKADEFTPLSFNWIDFQDKLKVRFMPPQYLAQLKDDWRALKKNGMPVMSFSNR
ncbi:hypothetical protein DD581_35430, partial [Klebsiella pneumoniae]